jgi:Uncharacterized protein conserved in bacteria (DUF2252)
MNIVKATRRFEEWLGQHLTLVKPDLRLKHQHMAASPFPFLRATFYRWIQIWPEVCPELSRAPRVLAVGDLHVENFGTWRDIEGRLVWGVNDFDEAANLSYANDLVRLATSAILAVDEGHLSLKAKVGCTAILDGYTQSLEQHGCPFVLAEKNQWLREAATGELRDPVHFWERMDSLPVVRAHIPSSAREAIEHFLPEPGLTYRTVKRVAGLGSLGHVRLVAIAECHGSKIAREAKAMRPSAVYWERDVDEPADIQYQVIITHAVRCPDPFAQMRGHWIVRRLAPYCSRIELNLLASNRDELRLLFAMGWETANIHLGSGNAPKEIRRHLGTLKADWLLSAARKMEKAVNEDFRAWKKSGEAER